ncbi:MAG: hypothetical protein RLZZ326_3558 [Planctomycetota bacterium]
MRAVPPRASRVHRSEHRRMQGAAISELRPTSPGIQRISWAGGPNGSGMLHPKSGGAALEPPGSGFPRQAKAAWIEACPNAPTGCSSRGPCERSCWPSWPRRPTGNLQVGYCPPTVEERGHCTIGICSEETRSGIMVGMLPHGPPQTRRCHQGPEFDRVYSTHRRSD